MSTSSFGDNNILLHEVIVGGLRRSTARTLACMRSSPDPPIPHMFQTWHATSNKLALCVQDLNSADIFELFQSFECGIICILALLSKFLPQSQLVSSRVRRTSSEFRRMSAPRSREREPRPEDLQYASYWDRRYEIDQEDAAALEKTSEGAAIENANSDHLPDYDWFRSFAAVKSFLTRYLPQSSKDSRLLHLGCGNSTLPCDLHKLGYHDQIAVDFSQVCITAMERKYAHLSPPVVWQYADVRDMKSQFEDASFDAAIDKGTLDAMLHGSLWDPPDDVRDSVRRYTDEVARLLKPGSVWLYVTYRQPHFMRGFLTEGKEDVWKAECETLAGEEGAFEYFGWVMRKHR